MRGRTCTGSGQDNPEPNQNMDEIGYSVRHIFPTHQPIGYKSLDVRILIYINYLTSTCFINSSRYVNLPLDPPQ